MAMTDTPAIERPISSWARLGPALREEGLIRTPIPGEVAVVSLPSRRAVRTRWMLQAAAGLFLAVGGAVLGRASVVLPGEGAATVALSDDTTFESTAEAMEIAQRASDQYQRAVEFIAANDAPVTLSGPQAAELMRTRLSARLDAFDQSLAATRAALTLAPQDPVLNNLYRQSVGVRNLTLRQMGEVVPVSSTGRTRF
jgi:hypothetical protein